MYLHVISVYLHNYAALLHEGIHTKMNLLFCEDHRNNLLPRFNFFMTFESQHDWICSTPPLTWPIIILIPLQNGIDSALKSLTWHAPDLSCMTSYRCTRTYILSTETSSTTSCISVLCERNNCTNTLCSSGDTLSLIFHNLGSSHLALCSSLCHIMCLYRRTHTTLLLTKRSAAGLLAKDLSEVGVDVSSRCLGVETSIGNSNSWPIATRLWSRLVLQSGWSSKHITTAVCSGPLHKWNHVC